MRVKRITIEFDPASPSDSVEEMAHAKKIVFENGMWHFDGPVFSRFGEMAHKVWQAVRDAK